MKRNILFYLIFTLLTVSHVHATCSGICYTLYCGPSGSHGYCTDYVESRLGSKPAGDAKEWTAGNGFSAVQLNNVQTDDIAVFDFGTYGHVAVVDSVDGDDVTISEWNYGDTFVSAECGVTDTYGEETTRTIQKSSVTRFLRLDPNSQNEHEVNTTAWAKSGNLAWVPLGVACQDATKWIDITTGNIVADKANQSVSGYVVCESYGILPMCKM